MKVDYSNDASLLLVWCENKTEFNKLRDDVLTIVGDHKLEIIPRDDLRRIEIVPIVDDKTGYLLTSLLFLGGCMLTSAAVLIFLDVGVVTVVQWIL